MEQLQGFHKNHRRLGAAKEVATISQEQQVHNNPEPSCAMSEPSTTPSNKQVGGRGEGPHTHQQGICCMQRTSVHVLPTHVCCFRSLFAGKPETSLEWSSRQSMLTDKKC